MEQTIQLAKIAGPKMVPFIKTVAIYFLLTSSDKPAPSLWSTCLKCAPIICLMTFILLYGIKLTKEYVYRQKIFVGLIFSCIGDAFLNINLFPHGMAAFAVAQLFYISAFGFGGRLRLSLGLILYIFGTLTILFIRDNIKSTAISIGLPIYTFLVITMCWRAIARVDSFKDFSQLTKITCAIGSILFLFSDAMIAVDKFVTPISYRTFWIMATYYAGQFGITLSIVSLQQTQKTDVLTQTSDASAIKHDANKKREKFN